ncbi:MAG: Hsp70 family protein [Mycobacterium sp.]
MYDPLGLSIGTSNLVAVRNGNPPVTRRAVLTLFPHRPPELGTPADNPANPDATDTGTLVSGFVERLGGSDALVSPDGSTHDPALLLVEALDAMISAAGGDASTSSIAIAVPAHWGPEAMRALQDALRTHAGFARSGAAPRLVSDAVTALTALNSDARLPADGVVGLLDFGGGGTSITLTDAASGFTPIADTLRYPEFSGDLIDQALLVHVLENLGDSNGADPASTAAVGQFAHLREECRRAKERLSNDTVTELVAELPGRSVGVQVSRAELENLIEDRLAGVFSAFDGMLRRNKVRRRDLAALAMAGGGARIPMVAQRLSTHANASVVTAVQPALAMAVGAVMLASRQPAEERGDELDPPTAMAVMAGASTGSLAAMAGASTGNFAASTGNFAAPTDSFGASTGSFRARAGGALVDEPPSETLRELAWSQADDTGNEPVLYTGEPYDDDAGGTPSQYLPESESPDKPQRRYRLPQMVFGIAAVIAMIAIGGVAYTLTSATDQQAPPAPTHAPVVPPPPVSSKLPSPPPPPPPPPSPAPSPSVAPPPTSVAPPPPPPPPPVTTTYRPPTTTQRPTTTTTTPPPSSSTTTTTTTSPPPPSSTTSTTTTPPMTTEYLRVPFVPVPIPIQVPQGQGSP